MAELIILRGIPGSGKTDLAEELRSIYTSAGLTVVVACADDYFMVDGKYEFTARSLRKAHLESQSTAMNAMEDLTDRVIIANTNTTLKEMKPYIDFANKAGYKIRSLIVENRHGNESVHNVPPESINKMKDRFQVSL